MSKTQIDTFETDGSLSIRVRVFITGLPPNSSATVHSHNEFSCLWFICYSVKSHNGRTEYFYELLDDSNESSDYVLNISYVSTRAIFSVESDEQIKFVNSNNKVLDEQDHPMFYEYPFNYENEHANDYKLFLVICRNRIVLFWHDYNARVIVKTLDLSSFDSFKDLDFTRVDLDIRMFDCFSLTFYTTPSGYNTYYSLYLSSKSSSKSFFNSNIGCVCKKHTFCIPCWSPFSGSQFIPDTDIEFRHGILRMDSRVDGEPQEESGSEDDSEAGSEAGSEDDSEDDSESGTEDDSESGTEV